MKLNPAGVMRLASSGFSGGDHYGLPKSDRHSQLGERSFVTRAAYVLPSVAKMSFPVEAFTKSTR